MAIVSIVSLSIKPEATSAAADTIRESVALARGFAGNLGIDALQDQADPTRWLLVEKWESEEADAAYRAYRVEAGVKSVLGPILNGAPEITKFDVSPE